MKKIFYVLSIVLAVFSVVNVSAQTAYWTEGFENTTFPSSPGPSTPTEFTVESGTWILNSCYRTTSTTGAPVGTADIRLLKTSSVTSGFSYIVTPVLTEGVGKVSFYEGRGNRTITIEKSLDGGTTWVAAGTVTTVAKVQNPININDAKANRIRISDQSSSDADIDEVSVFKFSGSTNVETRESLLNDFRLDQNYPNPFNPSTKIFFGLDKSSNVKLSVYNMMGQEVASIVNGFLNAGQYETSFYADNLPTGIYI